MTTPARRALSLAAGWAADRSLPRILRPFAYRTYARFTGADLSEVRLALADFPSLAHFFVRELKPGARPIDAAPDALVSPVDGTVQAIERIEHGRTLQAKGRSYAVDEFLGGLRGEVDLEGGTAWTIYLSPRDYHRIHSPEACRVSEIAWLPGARYSVQPKVLARRAVLDVNERVVLRLESAHGPFFLVLVGALNVGRMRVVGIEPTARRKLAPEPAFARGAELARFEMGSTIVLCVPRGRAGPLEGLVHGTPVRLGRPIGRWTRA
ncbi:MAG: archaetidylserine decarboxylase [Planctomycetota bacterium]